MERTVGASISATAPTGAAGSVASAHFLNGSRARRPRIPRPRGLRCPTPAPPRAPGRAPTAGLDGEPRRATSPSARADMVEQPRLARL